MAAEAATAFHNTLSNERSTSESPSQSFDSEKEDVEKTEVPVAKALEGMLKELL
jgi:hypothetical protein